MADDKEGLAGFEEAYNPFTNPDTRPKSTLQFPVDPMAETVRGLPARLMQNVDENLTKNITAYTPRPKESQYGSIRMPRMGDDPADAGMFVMAGPIAVEQALGKFAAKALPAKTIETKLLQMGASKAELETRGVTQYLEAQGTRPVHPLEVMKHLDDNPYQLNEIINKNPEPFTAPAELDAKLNDAYARRRTYPFDPRLGRPNVPPELEQEIFKLETQLSHALTAASSKEKHNLPQFESVQTPGGENYREILLQAPEHPSKIIGTSMKGEPMYKYGEDPSFTGGHWDQPNVVAHMRVNDRTLPSGEKALHVEEWQSDWSNAVRSSQNTSGYKEGDKYITPSHPLVDNWQDLMARRTLKEAVDGGYDRVTWTTGQQQADRYDLSKHITTIKYDPEGEILKIKHKTSGEWEWVKGGRIPIDELPQYVGKDAANKILNGRKILSGLDLKVGGEWANKLYDESMVNRFNKIGKQYGVKVEDVPLTNKIKYRFKFNEQPNNPQSMREFDSRDEALQYVKEQFGLNPADMAQAGMSVIVVTGKKKSLTYNVHSLKITPEMKESIGASRFHPFADLPGPKPKVAPTPPPAPAAAKKVDLHAEAAAIDPSNPVRYVGDQMGYPLMQQEPPGVGSFIVRPGETVASAYARAKARYQK